MPIYSTHIGAYSFHIIRTEGQFVATGVNVYDPDCRFEFSFDTKQQARNELARAINYIRQ